MEDILASIKRIISEDQAPPPQPSAAPPVRHEPPPRPLMPQPSDSVLELTQRIPGRVPDRTAEPLPPSQPPSATWAAEPAPPVQPAAPVQRAVERLRQAEAEIPQPAAPRPVPRDLMPRTPTPRPTGGDITLDALVREALQPLLSEWIEKNLPDMVERLVQAEIRRMTERDG